MSEIEQLREQLDIARRALVTITKLKWGWDGSSGADDIAENALEQLTPIQPEAPKSAPDKVGWWWVVRGQCCDPANVFSMEEESANFIVKGHLYGFEAFKGKCQKAEWYKAEMPRRSE